MSQTPVLSHKQVVSLIKAVGHMRTVIVCGENGVGKTAIQNDLRNDPAFLGFHVMKPVDCMQLSDGSVWMPDIDREAGVSRELPNERFNVGKHNHKGISGATPSIICLDEVLKAPNYIKNVLAPILYERRIGNFEYAPNSIIWGSSNLMSEGLGDILQAHFRTRVLPVSMRKPWKDEWVNEFAIPNNLHPVIIATAEMHPRMFESFTDFEEGGKYANKRFDNEWIYNPKAVQDGYASPRTLHAASDVMYTCENLDNTTLLAALCGAVGEATARAIMAIYTLGAELPSFERIVADPVNTPVTTNATAQLVQVFKFVTVVSSREEADAVCTYVKRLRAEMTMLFVNLVSTSSKVLTFATVAQFQEMLRARKDTSL